MSNFQSLARRIYDYIHDTDVLHPADERAELQEIRMWLATGDTLTNPDVADLAEQWGEYLETGG